MTKVQINAEQLKKLGVHAKLAGTEHQFIDLAVEFAEACDSEIVRLRKALQEVREMSQFDSYAANHEMAHRLTVEIPDFIERTLEGRGPMRGHRSTFNFDKKGTSNVGFRPLVC